MRTPRIYLMDEPLSNLDAKLREALRIELKHLQHTQRSTVLFVTHDQVEALTLADRIGVLREGRLIQIGSPADIYDRPASVYVAQMVGSPRINLLPATRVDGMISLTGTPVTSPAPEGAQELPESFTLGVRPEDVVLGPAGEHEGVLSLIEPLGVETVLHIQCGEQTLVSLASGMVDWQIRRRGALRPVAGAPPLLRRAGHPDIAKSAVREAAADCAEVGRFPDGKWVRANV